MRVVLYGLQLSAANHLQLPNMQCVAAEEWSAVQELLLVTTPSVLVVHEEVAREAIEWVATYESDLSVAVVARDGSAHNVRHWTAAGATWVWTLGFWLEQLSQAFAPARREGMQEAVEAFRGPLGSEGDDAITIGVASVYSGAGSTHTALSIAHFLADNHERVALWEAGEKPCFDFLEYSIGGSMNRKPKFDLGRYLTVFKSSASLELVELVSNEYRYIIYDLGCMDNNPRGISPIFTQAQIPVLVGSGSLWRQQEILHFCRRHSNIRQDKWRIALPFMDPASAQDYADCLAGRFAVGIPGHNDPAVRPAEVDHALSDLLGLSAAKKETKRFWSFR
ncbi:hypothetical protein D3P09_02725 [Paenibacillus pinisoli]|uniref:ParA family protein n=1 Tax=Paenibacillus pinisoli TaxID=1276110 RepID=A0A3A6PKQ8_9BACL|nr:hypothetical protein [Paenibacillus pinisoli]RJX40950.1 hypothetical protein D3P09_02725 [Paenibacillus pinisoli]